ncbi:MAG: hypothetical protein C7B47_11910 [Sulfobacillus thermosulfidooxidans]|uniref:4Fe-4S ferredoxin-type domain-containing protein n=1 Tax=Sulfobacillus thermosulfidooxidans TaxID=28034 RepID=A0A2T2WTL8_SULTH|nr:MAG: hypothetical protein C7B47_11910 [Sulfobacillus thermosulfidooxidans]
MATIAVVNHERCVGCELCTRACGVTHAISLNLQRNWVEVSEALCWACGACEKMCPFSAIMLPPWAVPNKALRDSIYAKTARRSSTAAIVSQDNDDDEDILAGSRRL